MNIPFNSDLYLCNTKFSRNGFHVCNDSNLLNKLLSNSMLLTDYSYIKQDKSVRVNKKYSEIENYNYLIINNENNFYLCFITDISYISDDVTEIKFEIDYYHTYFKNIKLLSSFVERTHIPKNEDIKGKHFLEEGLEIGEYIPDSREIELFSPENVICVMVNAVIKPSLLKENGDIDSSIIKNIERIIFSDNFQTIDGNVYEGVANPYKIYLFNTSAINEFYKFIKNYVELGGEKYILAIYLAPKEFVVNDSISSGTLLNYSRNSKSVYKNVSFDVDSIDNYKPKNMKLFSYPFSFCKLQNGQGNQKIVKFENQKNVDFGNINFISYGTISTPTPSVKTYIMSEKYFDEENYISKNNWIQLAWNSDTFKNWIANNAGNMMATLATAGVSLATAYATGGTSLLANALSAGSVGSVVQSVGNFTDKARDIASPKGSLGGGVVDVFRNKMTITAQKYSIKKEYAQIIDNFFSMYGYKINKTMIPDINCRNVFNYIKTNGLNISGNINENTRNYIKNLFDNGVTIWHNYDNMLNYEVSND